MTTDKLFPVTTMLYSDSRLFPQRDRDGEDGPATAASSSRPTLQTAICAECGHSLAVHDEEPPYECWGAFEECSCHGFSYTPKLSSSLGKLTDAFGREIERYRQARERAWRPWQGE